MDSRDRHRVIGAGVAMAGLTVLIVAYAGVGRSDVPGYELVARFDKADGLGLGSDVRLSGVGVGKVVGQTLDARFRAVITMRVAPGVTLPDDSAAAIQTDGLLGAKFIALQPGASDAALSAGAEFHFTQGSMNVEDLLELVVAQAESKHSGHGKVPAGGAAH